MTRRVISILRRCIVFTAVLCWPVLNFAGGYVPGCTEAELLYTLTGGGDVNFSEDCSITLTAPIQIEADTTIDAGDLDISLSGGGTVRLFNVLPGHELRLIGLTLQSGLSTNGGAIYVETNARVVLEDCTFSGNSAKGAAGTSGGDGEDEEIGNGGDGHDGKPGSPALGGAIYNLGSLVITRCNFVTNTATAGNGGDGGDGGNGSANAGSGGDGAGGAFAAGGAVYNLGDLTIEESTFSRNNATAGNGGAGGAVGEGAFGGLAGSGGGGGDASGGALFTENSVEILKSTFASNFARGGNGANGGTRSNGTGSDGRDGGKAAGGAIYADGEAGLINCTIYTNSTIGGVGGKGGDGNITPGNGGDGGNGLGGGIYNLGSVQLTHCTLAQGGSFGGTNGVAGGGAFQGEPGEKGRNRGGNIMNAEGSFKLLNTIIAGSVSGENGYGNFSDEGGNLSSDGSLGLSSESFSKTNPQLGTLGNYGGSTPTVNLLSGSPAINTAKALDDVDEDQRGSVRPDEITGKADIGAFEGQAPEITTQPQSQTRPLFGIANFTVIVEGDSPLRYNWSLDGEPLTSGTNNTFTISTITTNDAGTYSVVVSNAFGAVTSAPAVLTIVSAPLIQQQPTNQTVAVGGTAIFSVSANGAEPLAYQWNFNTTNLLANATNSVLVLSNVQMTNAGTYSVTVTNSGGSDTSLAATLTVSGGATITPPTIVSNQITFGISSVSNQTYVLEFKDLIDEPIWTPMATNQGNGSIIIFQDPMTNSSRYYRLLLQ